MRHKAADQQESTKGEKHRRDERTCDQQSRPALSPVEFVNQCLDMSLRRDHPERLIELRLGAEMLGFDILVEVFPRKIVQADVARIWRWLRRVVDLPSRSLHADATHWGI
jgi:hypothetical protein